MFTICLDRGGIANWYVCNQTYDYGQQRIDGVPEYFGCEDNTIDILNNPQIEQCVIFENRKIAERASRWVFNYFDGKFDVLIIDTITKKIQARK